MGVYSPLMRLYTLVQAPLHVLGSPGAEIVPLRLYDFEAIQKSSTIRMRNMKGQTRNFHFRKVESGVG